MNHRVAFLGALIVVVNGALLPKNPCPNLFRYQEDGDRMIYGALEFPNDGTGNYELAVNMSVAALLAENQNIKLELQTSVDDLRAGKSPSYNVYFPIQEPLPKLTRVEFNGNQFCSGPPEPLLPGGAVTNMWAKVVLRTMVYNYNIQYQPISPQTRPPIPPTNQPAPRPSQPPPSPPISPSTAAPTVPTVPTPSPFTSAPQSTPSSDVGGRLPDDTCGQVTNVQNLIVNGEKVQNGEYPWLVAIMYWLGSNYNFRCGSNLISNRHIITAGHCVQYQKALLFSKEELLLVVGKYNIRNWAKGALLRYAEDIQVHPDYKQGNGDADVAVITMNELVQFKATVRPLCLWNEQENLKEIVGKRGTVVGWGMDETGAEYVQEPTKIDLPIVSQEDCLRSNRAFVALTSNRTFCAGRRNQAGPCTGDSGTGFIMERNGRWTLRGIVSVALKGSDGTTCDLDNYVVMTDVAKVMSWVKSNMT